MRYLLDTHVVLWIMAEPDKIPASVVEILQAKGNSFFCSLASVWEIVIKSSSKKLLLPAPFEELFPTSLERAVIKILSIEFEHIAALRFLPWNHRDPFDRLLIAQCQVEELTLVSGDRVFIQYDVSLFWP